MNDATVAHVEWSGGRAPSLLHQAARAAALATPANDQWRNRLAAGLTYTTASNLSLTAEFHYNGGGLDKNAWESLHQGPSAVYGPHRAYRGITANNRNLRIKATFLSAKICEICVENTFSRIVFSRLNAMNP